MTSLHQVKIACYGRREGFFFLQTKINVHRSTVNYNVMMQQTFQLDALLTVLFLLQEHTRLTAEVSVAI